MWVFLSKLYSEVVIASVIRRGKGRGVEFLLPLLQSMLCQVTFCATCSAFFTQDMCNETLPSVTSLPLFAAALKGSLRKVITDATSRDDCGGKNTQFFCSNN